jgi:hypothetical protein
VLERGSVDGRVDVFLGHYVVPSEACPDGLQLVIHNTSREEFARDPSNFSRWSSEKIRNLRRWGCQSHDQLCADQCNEHGSQHDRIS